MSSLDKFNDHMKKIILEDRAEINDDSSFNYRDRVKPIGRVFLTNPDTGEVIWTGKNKVIFPGGEFLAKKMFDLPDMYVTPSYNTALILDNCVYTTSPENIVKTCLFCVGTDGCGRENSQIFEVDYRKWINEESIVPFRHCLHARDLTAAQRANIYFGRKTTDTYYEYYFKSFDSNPQLVRQFTDGTLVDETLYTVTHAMPAEVFCTMTMSLDKYDCRDYFYHTTGLNDARINCISLCAAWYKMIEGYKVYQDIRPVTRLNFPNESLIDLRKGIDITYLVYF